MIRSRSEPAYSAFMGGFVPSGFRLINKGGSLACRKLSPLEVVFLGLPRVTAFADLAIIEENVKDLFV